MAKLTPGQIQALTEAFHQARTVVEQELIQALLAVFNNLGSWADESDRQRFLDAALPLISGSTTLIARLTDAYIAACVGHTSGHTIEGIVNQLRNGSTPDHTYRRVFSRIYAQLAQGKSLEDSLDNAATYMTLLAREDTQLAHRLQAQASFKAYGVRAYRRVPIGESTCALCLIASTQRYHIRNLMPIHPGCDCDVAPLPSGMENRQIIDPEQLEQIHQFVDQRFGIRNASATGYQKLLITTHDAELGPQLSWTKPRRDKNYDPEGWQYWLIRQQNLKTDTHSEFLQPREIQFLERFEAMGHHADWIPRDTKDFTPTNDFIWIDNGNMLCELKSTDGKYKTIAQHIRDNVKAATAVGVTKSIFIIDRRHWPSQTLWTQLALYNVRNPENKIDRLFIAVGNSIREVDLVTT